MRNWWLVLAFAAGLHPAVAQEGPPSDLLDGLRVNLVQLPESAQRAGAKSEAPLVVQVTDFSGRPVPGAVVCFQLPQNGVTGRFSNGLSLQVLRADRSGKVSAGRVHWSEDPGETALKVIAVKGELRDAVTIPFRLLSPDSPLARARQSSGRKVWAVAAAAIGGTLAGLGLAGR